MNNTPAPTEPKKGWLAQLKAGLSRTSNSLTENLAGTPSRELAAGRVDVHHLGGVEDEKSRRSAFDQRVETLVRWSRSLSHLASIIGSSEGWALFDFPQSLRSPRDPFGIERWRHRGGYAKMARLTSRTDSSHTRIGIGGIEREEGWMDSLFRADVVGDGLAGAGDQ